MTRRDLFRLLLASPLAATFDVERALWVPKPMIVVPAMPAMPVIDGTPTCQIEAWADMIEITLFRDQYRSFIPIRIVGS